MNYFVNQLEQVVKNETNSVESENKKVVPDNDSKGIQKSLELHKAFWSERSKSYLPCKSVSKRHSQHFDSRVGSLTSSNQDIIMQIE